MSKSDDVIIFGYGSLMNEDSLLSVVPSARALRPAILRDYRRVFDTPTRYRKEKDGSPVATLTIIQKEGSWMNGISFVLPKNDLPILHAREAQYEFIPASVSSYPNGEEGWQALVLIVKDPEPFAFRFDSDAQHAYLNVCLEGAKIFGKDFLKDFRTTTYIGEQTLADLNL